MYMRSMNRIQRIGYLRKGRDHFMLHAAFPVSSSLHALVGLLLCSRGGSARSHRTEGKGNG